MTTTPEPQPVYLVRSQAERAAIDNAASWRSSAAICAVLFLTVIFAWLIPVVLIATVIGNNQRTDSAAKGTYDDPFVERVNFAAIGSWMLAGFLAVLGGLFLTAIATGAWGFVLAGLVMIGVAVALRPWRHRIMVRRLVS